MNDEQILHLMELAFQAGYESYSELCKPTCVKILNDNKKVENNDRVYQIKLSPYDEYHHITEQKNMFYTVGSEHTFLCGPNRFLCQGGGGSGCELSININAGANLWVKNSNSFPIYIHFLGSER